MALISDSELKSAIKFGNLTNIYYLYGKDTAMINLAVNNLKKKIIRKDSEDFNYHFFDGKNINWDGFTDAVEAYPLMAEHSLVVVNDLNAEKIGKDRLSWLLKYLADIPDTTIILFYTSSLDVTNGRKNPSAENKKLIDFVAKKGTVTDFAYRTPTALAKDIVKKSEKSKVSIDLKTAQIIAENCGCNTLLVGKELEKMLAFVGENGVIDREVVEELCVKTTEVTSFNLANAIAQNNRAKTFKHLGELYSEHVEPVIILSAVSGSLLDLYRAKLAITYGKSSTEVVSDFKYQRNLSFRVDNAFRDSRHFSLSHLRFCIKILSETDIFMKTSRIDQQVLLEKAIIKMLCGRKN